MTNLQRTLRIAILAIALGPGLVRAQVGTVRVRENLRAQPNGEVIGVAEPGLSLTSVGRRDRWMEVYVEGWVWMRSLQTVNVEGHDLVVSASEGENLRAGPAEAIVGRLARGTLLDEQERAPGWIRVQRRAWIWAASVDAGQMADEPGPAASAAGGLAPSGPASISSGISRVGGVGAAILAAPGGDTLAVAGPGAELQVLTRQGSWARVRMEGWTWLPPADSVSDMTVVLVTPDQLAADPERYRGRLVSWELQFLSVEQAERIRTDFFEGEPFLLIRHAGGGYVYVALTADRLAEAGTLLPLERITVVGRVRAPTSLRSRAVPSST